MTHRFGKHYSLEEAQALLPLVRKWLGELATVRDTIEHCEKRLRGLVTPGADLGGEYVNRWARALSASRGLLMEFYAREIQIKDIDRGLVDFPSILGGREVFLCWEKCEADIEFWHDIDGGFAGRKRL